MAPSRRSSKAIEVTQPYPTRSRGGGPAYSTRSKTSHRSSHSQLSNPPSVQSRQNTRSRSSSVSVDHVKSLQPSPVPSIDDEISTHSQPIQGMDYPQEILKVKIESNSTLPPGYNPPFPIDVPTNQQKDPRLGWISNDFSSSQLRAAQATSENTRLSSQDPTVRPSLPQPQRNLSRPSTNQVASSGSGGESTAGPTRVSGDRLQQSDVTKSLDMNTDMIDSFDENVKRREVDMTDIRSSIEIAAIAPEALPKNTAVEMLQQANLPVPDQGVRSDALDLPGDNKKRRDTEWKRDELEETIQNQDPQTSNRGPTKRTRRNPSKSSQVLPLPRRNPRRKKTVSWLDKGKGKAREVEDVVDHEPPPTAGPSNQERSTTKIVGEDKISRVAQDKGKGKEKRREREWEDEDGAGTEPEPEPEPQTAVRKVPRLYFRQRKRARTDDPNGQTEPENHDGPQFPRPRPNPYILQDDYIMPTDSLSFRGLRHFPPPARYVAYEESKRKKLKHDADIEMFTAEVAKRRDEANLENLSDDRPRLVSGKKRIPRVVTGRPGIIKVLEKASSRVEPAMDNKYERTAIMVDAAVSVLNYQIQKTNPRLSVYDSDYRLSRPYKTDWFARRMFVDMHEEIGLEKTSEIYEAMLLFVGNEVRESMAESIMRSAASKENGSKVSRANFYSIPTQYYTNEDRKERSLHTVPTLKPSRKGPKGIVEPPINPIGLTHAFYGKRKAHKVAFLDPYDVDAYGLPERVVEQEENYRKTYASRSPSLAPSGQNGRPLSPQLRLDSFLQASTSALQITPTEPPIQSDPLVPLQSVVANVFNSFSQPMGLPLLREGDTMNSFSKSLFQSMAQPIGGPQELAAQLRGLADALAQPGGDINLVDLISRLQQLPSKRKNRETPSSVQNQLEVAVQNPTFQSLVKMMWHELQKMASENGEET